MIYDESSRTLETERLARLMFRRNMEAALLAVVSGGLATAIGLPLKFDVDLVPTPLLVGIPLGLLVPAGALLLVLRRSPPTAAIERFSRVIESKRRAGAGVAALSRAFIVFVSVAAFVFALALMLLIPVD